MKERAGWWRNPVLLAAAGLALMVAGWQAVNYVPLTAEEAEKERQLDTIRAAVERQQPKVGDLRPEQLSRAFDEASLRHSRTRPYLVPGRLAVGLGLLLFVAAGVVMYRKPEPPPEEESENA